jgi:beta-glucosidase
MARIAKLDAGAKQDVSVEIDENDSSHPLSYWDTTSGSWKVAPGTYTVSLGNSSRNLTDVCRNGDGAVK